MVTLYYSAKAGGFRGQTVLFRIIPISKGSLVPSARLSFRDPSSRAEPVPRGIPAITAKGLARENPHSVVFGAGNAYTEARKG
jgi:hypothetical protein